MYAAKSHLVTDPAWRLLSDLMHLVFPKNCLACQEPIAMPRPRWSRSSPSPIPGPATDLGLCPDCRESLEPETDRCCLQCGASLERGGPVDALTQNGSAEPLASPPKEPFSQTALCPDCITPSPPIHRCVAVWSYQPPLDAVLQGLKFQRLPYLSSHLGDAIVHQLRTQLDPLEDFDLEDLDGVVPVPLHWRRRLQRGFDQTSLLAQRIARGLDLPLRPILRRCRATSAQSRLSREARQRNLAQAFVPRLGVSPWKHIPHFLLVDDVVTTGATLMAASKTLQDLGPCQITAVAAARTPVTRPKRL